MEGSLHCGQSTKYSKTNMMIAHWWWKWVQLSSAEIEYLSKCNFTVQCILHTHIKPGY